VETVITISGADKAGSLSGLVVFLTRKGYVVKGQKLAELPSGARLLKIRLGLAQVDVRVVLRKVGVRMVRLRGDEVLIHRFVGDRREDMQGLAQVDKEKLSAEIRALDPQLSVISVAFDGDGASGKAAAQTPAQSASALIKEMASQFPDVVALVRAYGGAFGLEGRVEALFEAGKKIGAFNYRKEWSLGNPLRMPAALRRALVPALEKFCTVQATDTQIWLAESPFCAGAGEINCCDFVTGFMQGFLDAGPLSMYTKVHKAGCRASGQTHCTYTVAYES